MGCLFGAALSRWNQVVLIDVNQPLVDAIRKNGVCVEEPDGTSWTQYPDAASDSTGLGQVDLLIVFVKAMYSYDALKKNRSLIGSDTCLMTLQNGSGHEEILLKFVDCSHVIMGTTQHNSSQLGEGHIRHGGSGPTHIGSLQGPVERLNSIADIFTRCGIETDCSPNEQKLIWDKMFTNVSASALTGILQVPLGYIAENPHAWALCETLIREAVSVAKGIGLDFDEQEKIDEVRAVCRNGPQGITSICSDIARGRRSEVDTISGSVVRASRKSGVPAPAHAFVVELIHAMEERDTTQVISYRKE